MKHITPFGVWNIQLTDSSVERALRLAKLMTLCIDNIKSSVVMDPHVTLTPQP